MRIALLTSQRVPEQDSLTRECLDLLVRWGVRVDAWHAIGCVELGDVTVEHDLYLLASPSRAVVSLTTGLAALGARCLNVPEMVRLCRDRIRTVMLLSSAGVPTPRTWVAGSAEDLIEPLRDGPVVLRSAEMSCSVGAKVLWNVDEVIDLPLPEGATLAQEVHPNDQYAHRVYRIGHQTFAVKRPCWMAFSSETREEPVPATDEMCEIADRVASMFRSELFGLDLVGAEGRLQVVEVRPFPRLGGVPDAALRLADYIYARGMETAEEVRR